MVRAFVKGAPDVLIARGGSFWMPGGEVAAITDDNRSLALKENDRMAAGGERVMVVARRDFDPQSFDPKSQVDRPDEGPDPAGHGRHRRPAAH